MKYKVVNNVLRFSIISFIFVASIIIIQKALVAQTPPTSPICCAYCSTGKACGNGCISKGDTCSKPKGCACDGERPEFEGNFKDNFPKTPIPLEDELYDELRKLFSDLKSSQKATSDKFETLYAHFSHLKAPDVAQNTPQSFKCSVPVVATIREPRDIVVKKRMLTIELFDADKEDGDLVSLYTDKLIYSPASLTKTGIKYTIDLGNDPGSKTIGVQFFGSGKLGNELRKPIATPGISINEGDIVVLPHNQKISGGRLKLETSLAVGQKAEIKVGFPHIYVSNSNHPQSACHIAEALRIPPVPMEKPKPGRTANPLRPSYPRVLTIVSKSTANTNRRMSTKNYQCLKSQNGNKEQRDEYPQATYVENAGSAHIKCIDATDNQGSGGSITRQTEKYGSRKVKLLPGDTIEMFLAK